MFCQAVQPIELHYASQMEIQPHYTYIGHKKNWIFWSEYSHNEIKIWTIPLDINFDPKPTWSVSFKLQW